MPISNPFSHQFSIHANAAVYRNFLWSLALVVLSAWHTGLTKETRLFSVFLVLTLIVAVLCLGGCLFSRRKCYRGAVRVDHLALSLAHCLAIVIHGLRFWTFASSNAAEVPLANQTFCFIPAMQLLCGQMLPFALSLRLLPTLLSIVVPVIAYPNDFLQPVPTILMLVACVLPFLAKRQQGSNGEAVNSDPNSNTWASAFARVHSTSSNGRILPWIMAGEAGADRLMRASGSASGTSTPAAATSLIQFCMQPQQPTALSLGSDPTSNNVGYSMEQMTATDGISYANIHDCVIPVAYHPLGNVGLSATTAPTKRSVPAEDPDSSTSGELLLAAQSPVYSNGEGGYCPDSSSSMGLNQKALLGGPSRMTELLTNCIERTGGIPENHVGTPRNQNTARPPISSHSSMQPFFGANLPSRPANNGDNEFAKSNEEAVLKGKRTDGILHTSELQLQIERWSAVEISAQPECQPSPMSEKTKGSLRPFGPHSIAEDAIDSSGRCPPTIFVFGAQQEISQPRFNPEVSLDCQVPGVLEEDELAGFAHAGNDTRTPLITTITLLDLLLFSKVMGLCERKMLTKQARASAQSALILLNNVMDYSKLRESHSAKLPCAAKSKHNPRLLIADVLRNLVLQATLASVELVLSATPSLPTMILCDGVLLQRVVLNYLLNAIENSQFGGRIVVCLSWNHDESRLRISVFGNEGISSTAPPAADVAFTLNGGTCSSGLGLCLCQRYISAMGGATPGRGDPVRCEGCDPVFDFEVPVFPVSTRTPLPIAVTAWILDEDRVRGRALEDFLRYLGVTCVLVHTALEMASSTRCNKSAADNEGQSRSSDSRSRDIDIVFICTIIPSWEMIAHGWRARHSDIEICVVVPNTVEEPLEDEDEAQIRGPSDMPAFDHTLHSPFDLREIQRIISLCTCSPALIGHVKPNPVPAVPAECQPDGTHSSTIIQGVNHVAPSLANENIPILLAEDNLVNRRLFAMQLTSLGFTNVHLARTGLEAIELATLNCYALILMDCHMPLMDGCEATRRIRAMPKHVQTPILALTAVETDENVLRCQECGMSEVIAKPISRESWNLITEIAQQHHIL